MVCRCVWCAAGAHLSNRGRGNLFREREKNHSRVGGDPGLGPGKTPPTAIAPAWRVWGPGFNSQPAPVANSARRSHCPCGRWASERLCVCFLLLPPLFGAGAGHPCPRRRAPGAGYGLFGVAAATRQKARACPEPPVGATRRKRLARGGGWGFCAPAANSSACFLAARGGLFVCAGARALRQRVGLSGAGWWAGRRSAQFKSGGAVAFPRAGGSNRLALRRDCRRRLYVGAFVSFVVFFVPPLLRSCPPRLAASHASLHRRGAGRGVFLALSLSLSLCFSPRPDWSIVWPFCAPVMLGAWGRGRPAEAPACANHRQRGDSNPCGQSPMDFESISLAARTHCLAVCVPARQPRATRFAAAPRQAANENHLERTGRAPASRPPSLGHAAAPRQARRPKSRRPPLPERSATLRAKWASIGAPPVFVAVAYSIRAPLGQGLCVGLVGARRPLRCRHAVSVCSSLAAPSLFHPLPPSLGACAWCRVVLRSGLACARARVCVCACGAGGPCRHGFVLCSGAVFAARPQASRHILALLVAWPRRREAWSGFSLFFSFSSPPLRRGSAVRGWPS